MSNLILWAHQATVDYTYRVGDNVSKLAGALLETGLLPDPNEPHNEAEKALRAALQRVRTQGLLEDTWLDVTRLSTPDTPKHLQQVRDLLSTYPSEVQIGGNPAISAIRGYRLRQGPEETDLPLVFYAGLYPDSVREALQQHHPDVLEAFRVQYPVHKWPQTVALETARAKLGLIYGPGRSLADLAPDGNFTSYLNLVESVMAGTLPKSRVVFALNTPTLRPVKIGEEEIPELEVAIRLLKELKAAKYGDRVRVFLSTRSFGRRDEEIHHFAQEALALLNEADIISASDAEIHALHTAHRGEYHDEPLAYKLRELPFEAIKVCHSADGVIMDLGCRPERIITSQGFRRDPPGFLEEVLRLSADGATYALDATAGLGRTANEAMIRIYSRNVLPENRHADRFKATFQAITEPMPAGMVWIPSARVVRTLGAVVGLGAIFDGLLLAFLMRN